MVLPGAIHDVHAERLRSYYEDTWFDYRTLWLDPRTWAMHFGYDAGVGGLSHADALLALNEVMATRAGLRPGDRVLDAGCGVGGTALWLTEQRNADAVGINVVADHIARARRHAAERGLGGRPRFEVLDYCDTGLASGSFDVIWATESACHAPAKPPFAAEAIRLLRPGGRLVMAEYVTLPRPGGPHPEIARWEQGWEMTLEPAAVWSEVLTTAGFVDIEIEDVTEHMRASLQRLQRLCLVLGPVARLARWLRMRTDAAQRNISGSRAMWQALQARAWFYAILTASKPAA
jgi:SAM-dependent methyltransferase